MTQTSNEITKAFAELTKNYHETSRPAETIAATIAAIGYDRTAETIAAAINCKPHDGRIEPANRQWAQTVTTEGGAMVYLPGID